jgi:hypothetical protein
MGRKNRKQKAQAVPRIDPNQPDRGTAVRDRKRRSRAGLVT